MNLYDGKYVGSQLFKKASDLRKPDDIKRGCWWYLPVSIIAAVLAYAAGFLSAATKVIPAWLQ